MHLDATTKLLKAVLGGAVSANQCHVVAAYEDVDQNGKVTHGSSTTLTNSDTAVTAVAAPGEVTTRKVKSLTLHNADTAAVTATIQYYDGTDTRTIVKATLQTTENLVYTEAAGWEVVTASGARKGAVTTDNATLADGKMWVGNASNQATAVTPSGDVTVTNAGVTAIGAGKVLSAMMADELVRYAEVTIPSADITDTTAGKLGHAQGQQVLAAPGADKALEFLSGVVINDYDTAAYTAGGNVTFNYGGGGSALSAAVSAANSLGAAADKVALVAAAVPTNNQLVANTAINLVAAAAFTQPGTAAGVCRVKVAYRVHDLGLA